MGKRWVFVSMVLICLVIPQASPGSSIPTLDITPLGDDNTACGRYKYRVTVVGANMYYAPLSRQNMSPSCGQGGYFWIVDGAGHSRAIRQNNWTNPPYGACDPQYKSWWILTLDICPPRY